MILLLSTCISDHHVDTIDAESVLDQLSEKKLSVEELSFDLVNLLYLDTTIARRLHNIVPRYMKEEKVNVNNFYIDEEAKIELSLSVEYQSVSELLNSMDSSLTDYLHGNFGIKDVENSVLGDILILDNKAFVEFENNGSVQAVVLELDSPKTVKVALAYMLID